MEDLAGPQDVFELQRLDPLEDDITADDGASHLHHPLDLGDAGNSREAWEVAVQAAEGVGDAQCSLPHAIGDGLVDDLRADDGRVIRTREQRPKPGRRHLALRISGKPADVTPEPGQEDSIPVGLERLEQGLRYRAASLPRERLAA